MTKFIFVFVKKLLDNFSYTVLYFIYGKRKFRKIRKREFFGKHL